MSQKRPESKDELKTEEIQDLVRQICGLLIECELADAKVEIFRETICDLQMTAVFSSVGV
jgi:hypothetical protein